MDYKELMKKICDKELQNVKNIGASFPYNDVDGKFRIAAPTFWTNGFYPGLLWICYLESKDKIFKDTAEEIENMLDKIIERYETLDHDVGFIWLLTAGIHNQVEKNDISRQRLLHMANVLAGRFNIKGNFIQAWDAAEDIAIIDCMMNIQLLFWAYNQTKHIRYYHIATAYCDTILKYFIDDDGAVRHMCRINASTGVFEETLGGQGYSPTSAWSRGAGWAIYGLSMAYEQTKEKRYLNAAEKAAKFFISQLGDDYVPAWDFRADNIEVKDASAGAIAASGMLEIYKLTNDAIYKENAEKIINGICDFCLCLNDSRQALVTKCTAFFGANENVEVGLIYGDYYFAEAVYKLASNDYDLLWQ